MSQNQEETVKKNGSNQNYSERKNSIAKLDQKRSSVEVYRNSQIKEQKHFLQYFQLIPINTVNPRRSKRLKALKAKNRKIQY